MKHNIGKNLNEWLVRKGLTQIQFSKKLGMSQSTVSQLISGDKEPSLSTLIKILKVLNIKFEALIK